MQRDCLGRSQEPGASHQVISKSSAQTEGKKAKKSMPGVTLGERGQKDTKPALGVREEKKARQGNQLCSPACPPSLFL